MFRKYRNFWARFFFINPLENRVTRILNYLLLGNLNFKKKLLQVIMYSRKLCLLYLVEDITFQRKLLNLIKLTSSGLIIVFNDVNFTSYKFIG